MQSNFSLEPNKRRLKGFFVDGLSRRKWDNINNALLLFTDGIYKISFSSLILVLRMRSWVSEGCGYSMEHKPFSRSSQLLLKRIYNWSIYLVIYQMDFEGNGFWEFILFRWNGFFILNLS